MMGQTFYFNMSAERLPQNFSVDPRPWSTHMVNSKDFKEAPDFACAHPDDKVTRHDVTNKTFKCGRCLKILKVAAWSEFKNESAS